MISIYSRQFFFFFYVYGWKKISWMLSFDVDEWMSECLLELDQASVCEYITTVKNTFSGGFLNIPNGHQCWINQMLFSYCVVYLVVIFIEIHREKKLILMHCAIEARDPFFRPHWSLLKLKTALFLLLFLKTFEEFNLWTNFPPCLCLSGLLAVRYLCGKEELLIVLDVTTCGLKLHVWDRSLPATSSPNRNGIQSGDTWHGSQAQYQIQCVSLNAVQNKRSLHLVQT